MTITKEKVIEFGAWLTGHDEETVAELLDDYNHYKERKVNVPAETLAMPKIADENIKLIKHLAKRKIEDCKYSAYNCYDAGNDSEGDFGLWEDWEKVLADFATEILTKVSEPSA